MNYRATVESAAVGIANVGTDGRLLRFNDKLCEILGYSRDELLQKTFIDLTHPDDVDADLEQARRLEEGEIGSFTMEKRYIRKNGSIVWASLSASAVRDRGGKLLQYIGVVEEVTKRKEAERRYRSLFEQAGVGIVEGTLDGVIATVNSRACEILGYSRDELVGMRAIDLSHPDDVAKTKAAMDALERLGGSQTIEKRYRRKDGSYIWVSTTVTKVRSDEGELHRYMAILEDITAAKDAQRQVTEGQARLEAALSIANLGVWEYDEALHLTYIDNQCRQLFGLSDKQPLCEQRFLELIHPDDRQRVAEALQKVLDTPGPASYATEYRIQLPDGRIRWILARGGSIDLPGEGCSGPRTFTGTVMDVTEHKLAEDALRQAEQRQRFLVRLTDHVHAATSAHDIAKQACRLVREEWNVRRVLFSTIDRDRGHWLVEGNHSEDGEGEVGLHPLSQFDERFLELHMTCQPMVFGSIRDPILRGQFRTVCGGCRELRSAVSVPILAVGEWVATLSLFHHRPRHWSEADVALIREVADRIWNAYSTAQAEQVRKESLDRLRLLAEANVIGIVTAEGDTIVDANDEYLRMLCRSREELESGHIDWRAITPSEYQKLDQRALEQMIATGKCEPFEKEYVLEDGTRVPVLLGAAVIEREPLRWVCFVLDLSSKVAAQEALAASESLYRTTAEIIPQILTVHSGDGRLIWASSQWQCFFGRPFSEFGDRFALIHPDDRTQAMRKWIEALETGQPLNIENRLLRHDGQWRWFRGSVHPLRGPDGRPERWVGSYTDIHDQKESEAELEERVRQRTLELEAFTYSVAHDLRAPLRAITSSSRIVLDEAEGLSSEHRKILARQASNATKLAKLIDDLLALSRLGSQDLAIQEIDLTELASEAAAAVNSGGCEFDIQPGLRASADPRLLKLVLVNLLDNACKYSPKGGCVRVGIEGDAFFVRDNGIGIEMQYADRIFQPFERLHREEQFPGSGVGLASVRRAIERHNGRAWVQSAGPGQGSTFFFTLP